MAEKFGHLILHDQKGDAVDTRYSVQTPEGGVLFLFNECGLTAREVFETFVFGCDKTLALASEGDEIERLRKTISAAGGYLMNAKIDLETNATKRTAVRTIEGGIKMIEAALHIHQADGGKK